jgi:hypothetical protein
MHFGNFSLTVFLKKLKKEQFDSSYFCDSRYIYLADFSDIRVLNFSCKDPLRDTSCINIIYIYISIYI